MKIKFKEKYRIKKRFLLCLGLSLYVFFCFGHQFYRIHAINIEIEKYNKNQKDILTEQKQLNEEIALLNNKSYIERIAREDLGLIRQGETLIVPGEEEKMPEVKALSDISDNIH